MGLYAKIIEDNGGGITLYILDSAETCIYAHSGYEFAPGQLSKDLAALIEDDSCAEWDGNEPELVAEWPSLDLDGPGRQIIAKIQNGMQGRGRIRLYPSRMGAAGKMEFAVD